jgi:hypothetical protein
VARHEDPTRVAQIGAWLVVAFGVVIVAVGLIVSTVAGATRGGPFYFGFYLAVAAPPLVAGILALRRPSLVTKVVAAVVGGVYGAFLGVLAVFGRSEEVAARLGVLPLAAAGLASAALLTASIVRTRDGR